MTDFVYPPNLFLIMLDMISCRIADKHVHIKV